MTNRTTAHPAWTASGDLTAKARIRNAALELYAAKGEAATTVREVAQAAGVTHGLVVHHFVNKEGLRRAVQQHVVELFRRAVTSVPAQGSALEIGKARDAAVSRVYAEHPPLLRYIHRELLEPTSANRELLDLLVELTRSQVRDLRAAGVSTSNAPEHTQVLAILMRETGRYILEPVAQRLWTQITGGSPEPPPAIEVRIKR